MLLGAESDISSEDQARTQTHYVRLSKQGNVVLMYLSLINFVKK